MLGMWARLESVTLSLSICPEFSSLLSALRVPARCACFLSPAIGPEPLAVPTSQSSWTRTLTKFLIVVEEGGNRCPNASFQDAPGVRTVGRAIGSSVERGHNVGIFLSL